MKRKPLQGLKLLSFLIVNCCWLTGQVIETFPKFPTINDSVDVTFNVDSCACNLMGYAGDIYAHTGVLTTQSADNGDWKREIAEWGSNIEKAKLQKIDDKTYKLKISPNIKTYYSLEATDTVTSLAFVFRSSDGSKQSSNLYKKIYKPGLSIDIIVPCSDIVVKMDDTITIEAEAVMIGVPDPDSIVLYVDDTLKTVSYTTDIQYKYIVKKAGKYWIKIVAENEDYLAADSIFYFVRDEVPIADFPDTLIDGINYIDTSTVTLILHAPHKESAILTGDFNNWNLSNEYLMNRSTDGERYWITIDNLEKGKEYAFQYVVDGNIRIADPYADKVLDPANDQYIAETTYPGLKEYPAGKTTEIVSVFQTNQQEYEWEVTDFTPVPVTDLVIYELLVRDFTAAGNFQTLIDTLNYLENLGVNAIELMPVNEFEGNDSWGYNPSFYFAVDKAYGTKNDFKHFVDECHKRDIAVFMDMVLNHTYGQSPLVRLYFDPLAGDYGQPTSESPWYNEECPHSPWCWGNDFNHKSIATKTFVNRVNRYWIEEYMIDGYRFDFTKGFTNHIGDGMAYDTMRIKILKDMYDSIKAVNENTVVIFEHLSDNLEEKELANHGILLWGKMTDNYNEATMGYSSDLSGISYKTRGWDGPNLVGYMESHDEQRLMYKNITFGKEVEGYNVRDLDNSLRRIEAAASMFFTIPGPKMLWQFGELGYDVDIDYNGRVGKKPIRWEYFDNQLRNRLYQVFSALIKLRTEEPLFKTDDFDLSVNSALKRVRLYSTDLNAVIIANFDVVDGTIDPAFQHTGKWYNYFSGDSIDITNVNDVISLKPGHYIIYTDKKLTTPPELPSTITEYMASGELGFYPNPTNGQISFQSHQSGLCKIGMYNMAGKLIYSQFIESVIDQEVTLDINRNNVASGMYIVRLEYNNTVKQGKLVVK